MAYSHRAILFGLLACLVSENVQAEPCSTELILGCLGGLDMAGGSDNMDMEKVCGVLPCLENLNCEIPPEYTASLETPEIKQVMQLCQGGTTGCSVITMQKCMGDLGDMSALSNLKGDEMPTPEQLQQMCQVNTCLQNLLPTCEGELKTQVQTMTDQFKQACAPGCSVVEVNACMGDMKDMAEQAPSVDMITPELCKKMETMAACVKPLHSKCEGVMKNATTMVLQVAPCCSQSIDIKNKCFPEGLPQPADAEAPFDINKCKMREEKYTCVKGFDLKCTEGPISDGIKMAIGQYRKEIEKCGTEGYNVTVSFESGKSKGDPDAGVVSKPSAAILFGLVLAVVALWF